MRMVSNARAFGLTAQPFSGGWVIANWFVPVVNLWRPKQIVDGVWKGSGGLPTSLVDWWWTLAVISWLVLDPISAFMLGNRPGNPLRNGFNYTAFSTTVSAAVWVLAGLLVYRLVRLQRRVLAAPAHEG